LVERVVRNDEVKGSIPFSSTSPVPDVRRSLRTTGNEASVTAALLFQDSSVDHPHAHFDEHDLAIRLTTGPHGSPSTASERTGRWAIATVRSCEPMSHAGVDAVDDADRFIEVQIPQAVFDEVVMFDGAGEAAGEASQPFDVPRLFP
jgi:hypothetical protein